MTTFTVTVESTLSAALADAVGGDRIELAAGDYGALEIRNKTFLSGVTIVSADPANPAVIRGVYLKNSSHIVFDGILFDNTVAISTLFYISTSNDITIRNSVFDGFTVPDANGFGEYGSGNGIYVNSSDNITVENNEFFDFGKAIITLLSSNITVTANNAHKMSKDMFNFISADGVLVEGNWLHDFNIDPTSGNHPDMIQLWHAGGAVLKNIVIRGNFIDAGLGPWTQSIYMANSGDQFLNILIEHNVIYNNHSHGITVELIDGLVIRNNTLLQDPHTTNSFNPPRINLTEGSLNVTVENNITGDVWNWDAMTNQPGWIVGNNLLLEYDPAFTDFYAPMFVNALAVNATLADLRAVAGGVVELGGYGAAMTRADIPMVVGPFATAPTPPPETNTCEDDLVVALAALTAAEAERDASVAALVSMMLERDAALVDLAAALIAQADAEAIRDIAILDQAAAEVTHASELAFMTAERDAALLAQAAALSDLAIAETQLAVAVAKLTEIHVISEG